MNTLPVVLMIAYYFPPMGGAGVQRTLKFTKYLVEYGWQPLILTIRGTTRLQDSSLDKEIPEGMQVFRTPILRLPPRLPWRVRNFISRWLLIVDEQVGWLPFAKQTGQKVIAEQKIKLIYSTSAPYSAHLVARHLHHQTRLPWVADFRDPWVGNPYLKFPTVIHRQLNEHLEESVFTEADRVVLNTERSRQYYLQKYATLSPKNLNTI